jgi:hypothetical protein
MIKPEPPRSRRVTVVGFLAACLMLPVGALLAPLGIGIPVFALGPSNAAALILGPIRLGALMSPERRT